MNDSTRQRTTIHKIVRKTRNFTQVENTTIRDHRLSYKARGVLTYILSLPLDAGISAAKVAGQSDKDGDTAVRSAFKELEAAGYIVRRRWADEKGQWRTEITCYEVPPTLENSTSGEVESTPAPMEGNPTSENPPSLSKTDSDKTSENTIAPLAQTEVVSEHQQLVEALAEACGWDRHEIPDDQWALIGKAAKQLRTLKPPPTPDEVVRRGKVYLLNHSDWTISPSALVKWWADSAEVRRRPSTKEVQNELRRLEWQNAPAAPTRRGT